MGTDNYKRQGGNPDTVRVDFEANRKDHEASFSMTGLKSTKQKVTVTHRFERKALQQMPFVTMELTAPERDVIEKMRAFASAVRRVLA